MKNVFSIAAAGGALVIGLSLAGAAEIPTRAETTAAAKPTKQVIGDWVVSCAPAANGHNACVMSQTLASQKLKKTISVLSIGRDRAGKLTGSLRMPIGVSLPAGVVVGIANKDPFTVPYTACHRIGCFAPFDVTGAVAGSDAESDEDHCRCAKRFETGAQSQFFDARIFGRLRGLRRRKQIAGEGDNPVNIVHRIDLRIRRHSLTAASTGSNCDYNATLGKEAIMRDSNENGRFLRLSPGDVTVPTRHPVNAQNRRFAIRTPLFPGRKFDLCNRPNCDAARDHRS